MTDAQAQMREMIDALGLEEPSDGMITVAVLSDRELVGRYHQVTETLMDLGEAIKDKTEKGRDLHAQRSAILLEMRKRGLH